MPRANQQDSRELAVRARRRLQRDRLHAGDVEQTLLQQIDDFENALRQRLRPVRMRLCQPLDPGHKLIHARVVLHRARAQRIHPQIDRVVPRRESCEVANDLDLAQLRQQPRRLAMRIAQQLRRHQPPAHRAAAACTRVLARRRLLKDQPLVLRLVRTNLARRGWSLHFCIRCHSLCPANSQPL